MSPRLVPQIVADTSSDHSGHLDALFEGEEELGRCLAMALGVGNRLGGWPHARSDDPGGTPIALYRLPLHELVALVVAIDPSNDPPLVLDAWPDVTPLQPQPHAVEVLRVHRWPDQWQARIEHRIGRGGSGQTLQVLATDYALEQKAYDLGMVEHLDYSALAYDLRTVPPEQAPAGPALLPAWQVDGTRAPPDEQYVQGRILRTLPLPTLGERLWLLEVEVPLVGLLTVVAHRGNLVGTPRSGEWLFGLLWLSARRAGQAWAPWQG